MYHGFCINIKASKMYRNTFCDFFLKIECIFNWWYTMQISLCTQVMRIQQHSTWIDIILQVFFTWKGSVTFWAEHTSLFVAQIAMNFCHYSTCNKIVARFTFNLTSFCFFLERKTIFFRNQHFAIQRVKTHVMLLIKWQHWCQYWRWRFFNLVCTGWRIITFPKLK